MTRLPNADRALVEDAKVKDYLLNPGNPQNQGKAHLFERYGFERNAWPVLSYALRQRPIENEVVRSVTSSYGLKYVVECRLQTPDNSNPCVRTVWIVETGVPNPRFVTAY